MELMKNSVAVIGIGCRLPGAETVDEFWETLKSGTNHVVDIPNDRWMTEAYYDTNYDAPGKSYVNKAALIDRVHEYDTQLFGINDLEAERIDPQHKLGLEVAYRAIENAGLTEDQMKGTDTAVYMGQFTDDYGNLMAMDATYVDNYTATGVPSCMMSNRISYAFDIHGPSITVDTACSSAMVAVHLGCRSILNGESSMALCGGVNVILSPGLLIALSKARMASRKGQCFSFSEDADGYVRGEGGVIVLLKSAEKAIKDNDNIWGFLSTSCNSDGKASVPISTPSYEMQRQVIESTYRQAGVDPAEVDYVEMHGTGTTAGDAVESSSVGQTIGQAKKRANKPVLKIGSVKTNIGHLEAGAGTAAMLKLLLMMKHGQYVPTLFSDRPSSAIDFTGLHIEVANCMEPWRASSKGVRIGAINSFGVGGTNVHAIVMSDRRDSKKPMPTRKGNHPVVVALSGNSETSIRNSLITLQKAIREGFVKSMEDILLTSHNVRKHYKHRLGLVTLPTLEDLTQKIDDQLERSTLGSVKTSDWNPNVVFVFCGMGTHWSQMGLECYNTVDVFRETIDNIDKILRRLGQFTVKQCLEGHHELSDPQYGQPAIFGVQVGLFKMWEQHGITPNVIVGHSVGEVAAAYCSKHLTLESAVKVIFQRSHLLSKVQGGGMLVIGNVDTKQIEKLIADHSLEDNLNVAAYNSTMSCTVSGETDALKQLEASVKTAYEDSTTQKVFLRYLQVKVAYHSKYMDPMLKELATTLASLHQGEGPYIRHMSSVLDVEASSGMFASGAYWCKNVRNPVLFQKAFQKSLVEDCFNIIVELGPKPALRSYIKDIGKGMKMTNLASMSDGVCNNQFFSSLARMYEHGMKLHYPGVPNDTSYPRYGFHRRNTKRYPNQLNRPIVAGASNHPFIHPSADIEKSAKVQLSRKISPFVFDHILAGRIVVPGSTYVECAATTVLLYEPSLFSEGHFMKMSVNFNQHCRLNDEESKETLNTMLFEKEYSGRKMYEFNVTSPDILHASGAIELPLFDRRDTIDLQALQSRLPDTFPGEDLYGILKTFNFFHGPTLQCVKSAQRNDFEILARVSVDADVDTEAYTVNPVVMDSPFTLCVMFPSIQSLASRGQQVMPFGVRSMSIFSKLPPVAYVYCIEREKTATKMEVDAYIMDETGNICVSCIGIKSGLVGIESNLSLDDICFELCWENVPINKSKDDENRLGMATTDENQSTDSAKNQLAPGNDIRTEKSTFLLMVEARSKITEILTQAGFNNMIEINVNEYASKCENIDFFQSILPNNMNDITNVIFTLPCTPASGHISANDMGCHVIDRGYILIKLLQFLQGSHPHVVVHILTANVYELMAESQLIHQSSGLAGLTGYTFWGMARSIVIEMPYLKMQIIDLSDFESDTLETMMSAIGKELPDHMLTIKHTTARVCSLQELAKQSFRIPRSLPTSMDTMVSMCSAQQNGTAFKSKVMVMDNANKNKQLCHVHAVYLLHHDIKVKRASGIAESDFYCIGGVGKVNKEEVHIIQRIPATSLLSAEKVWHIPMKLLPLRCPCASLWYVAWYLCNQLKSEMERGDCVEILSLDNGKLWRVVTEQVFLLDGILLNRGTETQSSSIVVVAGCAEDVKHLIRQHKQCKVKLLILTWDDQLASSIENCLRHEFSTLSITVTSVEHCLESSSLMTHFKSFKKWVGKIKQKYLSESIVEVETVATDYTSVHISEVGHVTDCKNDILVTFTADHKSLTVTASKEVLFHRNAGYLVFGGSKGLGLETVKHMAENGAGKVGIVSRRGLSEENKIVMTELENKTGCELIELKADVLNTNDVKNVLMKFKAVSPHKDLRGVFIGAVILDDATIPNMTFSKFASVLQPKVCGTWNIYQLTETLDLDYFVIHSSVTSLIGRPGQTHYGAGCAFGDAVAYLRQLNTGCGQSVCWGALNLGVLEDREAAKKRLANAGVVSLNKQEMLQCFDHVLMYNKTVSCYAKFNWKAILKKSDEIVKSEANPFRKILAKKTYYIQKVKKTGLKKHGMQNPLPEGPIGEFLIELITSVLMLDVEDFVTDDTLDALGADSHQVTIIYSTMVAEFGNVMSLSPVDLLSMKVSELHKSLQDYISEGQVKAVTQGGEGQVQIVKIEKDPSNEFQVINLTKDGRYLNSSLQPMDVLLHVDQSDKVKELVIHPHSGDQTVRIPADDVTNIRVQDEESTMQHVEVQTRASGSYSVLAESGSQTTLLHAQLLKYFPNCTAVRLDDAGTPTPQDLTAVNAQGASESGTPHKEESQWAETGTSADAVRSGHSRGDKRVTNKEPVSVDEASGGPVSGSTAGESQASPSSTQTRDLQRDRNHAGQESKTCIIL